MDKHDGYIHEEFIEPHFQTDNQLPAGMCLVERISVEDAKKIYGYCDNEQK